MSILTTTAADCLRRTWGPFLVISAITFAALRSQPMPSGASQDMIGTLALWLHLPAILLSVIAMATPLESWPLLSLGRPGARHLRRLSIGPLQGCGQVAIATLLILALNLSIAGLLFDWQMQHQGLSRPAHAIAAAAPAPGRGVQVLGHVQRSGHYHFDANLIAGGLQLRPTASLGARDSYRPTFIQIFIDGQVLNENPLPVAGSADLISLEFAPRQLSDLEIRVTNPGDILLQFPRGSIQAISARSYPSALNSILAALSFLLPAGLSLATLILLRSTLNLPLSLALATAVLLACTLGELTPNSQAVQAYSRGLWIPSAGLAPASLRVVAVIAGLLCLAALVPRPRIS